jgi:hypothetical protein
VQRHDIHPLLQSDHAALPALGHVPGNSLLVGEGVHFISSAGGQFDIGSDRRRCAVMRKVLVVLIVAGVLVLALSVPALAAPAASSPDAWGQSHKTLNWGETPDGTPVPPGHRDSTNSVFDGNPGQVISGGVHLIKEGTDPFFGQFDNYGDFVAFAKSIM